jgi:predicted aspartyl protease
MMKALIFLASLLVALPSWQRADYWECALQKSAYNLIFAKARINGKETDALIDSGSFRTIQLSETLARELDLSLTETSRVARRYEGKELRLKKGRIERFVLGGFEQRDVEVEVIEGDIENIARQVKTKFDVIIGWGFLSQFRTMVDYKTSTLRFGKSLVTKGQEKMSFGYSVVNGVPVVNGALDDQPIKLLFDTGAPMCNLDPGVAKASVGEKVTREVMIEGNKLALEFRVKDLAAIRQSLGCSGAIGNNLLGRYEVYFDTAKRIVHLY